MTKLLIPILFFSLNLFWGAAGMAQDSPNPAPEPAEIAPVLEETVKAPAEPVSPAPEEVDPEAAEKAKKEAEALAAAAAKKKAEDNKLWVKIDLSEQKAYIYKDGKVIKTAPISSGKKSRPTPKGTYKVSQKDKWHRSGYYGSYVSKKTGRTVRSNVDSRKSSPPRGSYYRGASMFYFLRFNGPYGMHAGHLPGYPASHGCIRLSSSNAKTFYNYCSIGTKVVVQQ